MHLKSVTNLAYDIDGAHEYLVEVAILHEVRLLHDGVLQAGPDLALELLICQAEARAQVVHAHHGQTVEL